MSNDAGGGSPPPTGNYEVDPVDTSAVRDWQPLTITEHYQMLSQLRDNNARAASEMWGNAAALMESTRSNVVGYDSTLRQEWRSQAAEPFFEYVNGTNTSLDEWARAARTNQSRLDRLATAIETAQTQMETLYASFKAEVARIDENNFGFADSLNDPGPEAMAAEVAAKTEQSKAIMQTLSNVYDGTNLEQPAKFQGPADARPPTAGEMARAVGGGPGGPAPGAPPGGAGARPAAPGGQTQATLSPGAGQGNLGPPPAAPKGQSAGQQSPAPARALGPAPTAPTVPAANSAPLGTDRGAALAAPVIGGTGSALGPRGAQLAAPIMLASGAGGSGALRGAQAAALSIPGGATSGRPGAVGPPSGNPPQAPGSSTLQGRNAPTGPSAMPPPGPGRGMGPQIPGRSGMPSAPGMPGGARPGSPGLGGQPSRPGMGGQPGRPGMGSPGYPGMGGPPAGGRPGGAGRGAPGSPTLPGRHGIGPATAKPGAGMPPGGPGLPQSLQGTRGNPGGPGTARGGSGHGPIRPDTPGSSGTQGLRGRVGPARAGSPESAQTTRAALRRGLDGRGMSTVRGPMAPPVGGPPARPASGRVAGPAKRRDEERAAVAPQILGDEELFTVKTTARAVIEPTEEKVHAKRPGPALGRG